MIQLLAHGAFPICWAEIQAFLVALPFIGVCYLCIKNWLKGRKNDHPHQD